MAEMQIKSVVLGSTQCKFSFTDELEQHDVLHMRHCQALIFSAWIIYKECFVFIIIILLFPHNSQKIIRFVCCSTACDRQEALRLQRQTGRLWAPCVCVCFLHLY